MFTFKTRYRVLKSFESDTDSFAAGEVLSFKEANYGRYDSSSAFSFESQAGEQKTWFLRDDDPDDSKDRFAPVV
jgi:hypothetical protein